MQNLLADRMEALRTACDHFKNTNGTYEKKTKFVIFKATPRPERVRFVNLLYIIHFGIVI